MFKEAIIECVMQIALIESTKATTIDSTYVSFNHCRLVWHFLQLFRSKLRNAVFEHFTMTATGLQQVTEKKPIVTARKKVRYADRN